MEFPPPPGVFYAGGTQVSELSICIFTVIILKFFKVLNYVAYSLKHIMPDWV